MRINDEFVSLAIAIHNEIYKETGVKGLFSEGKIGKTYPYSSYSAGRNYVKVVYREDDAVITAMDVPEYSVEYVNPRFLKKLIQNFRFAIRVALPITIETSNETTETPS